MDIFLTAYLVEAIILKITLSIFYIISSRLSVGALSDDHVFRLAVHITLRLKFHCLCNVNALSEC